MPRYEVNPSQAVKLVSKGIIDMMSLGGKTAQSPSEDENVYLVALIGQSHASGAAYRSSMIYVEDIGYDLLGIVPVDRSYIFDKVKTTGRMLPELTDSSRGGAAFQFRPMNIGYGGDSNDLYPWESLAPDPIIGPETEMAANWVKHRKGKLLVVKMTKGGSVVALDSGPCWNVAKTGSGAYTTTFINAYWNLAYASALAMVGGNSDRVKVLGGISMIGTSDARSPVGYQANMLAVIDAIRTAMGNVSLPWLVVKSPRALKSDGSGQAVDGIDQIREQQDGLESETGIVVIDSEGLPLGVGDTLHFSADGYNLLGARMARVIRGF